MITAILSVLLAMSTAAPAEDNLFGEQQQNPPVESPKATIPAVPPEAAKPAEGTPATDPSKMAAPSAEAGKTPTSGGVNDKSYVIGPEDMLFVTVWGNQALSGQALVRPDGKISVALVGELVAAGQTPEQLGSQITERLKAGGYLRSPQVTVTVTQVNSKKFFIQGEVNKPGAYSLFVPTTVLEALVNAGGFRDFANKKDIRIMRGTERLKFNYNQVIQGKHREQNILVEPGDIILVK